LEPQKFAQCRATVSVILRSSRAVAIVAHATGMDGIPRRSALNKRPDQAIPANALHARFDALNFAF
jgi:hypothetical protein